MVLAMQRLALDAQQAGETVDWLEDDWAVFPTTSPAADPTIWVLSLPPEGQGPATASGQVTIHITDEERRLDLNGALASPRVLQELLGVADVAQAIVDYRDTDNPPDPAEDRPDAQPPYFAKDAPIMVLEELLEVPAIQEHPDTIPTLMSQATSHTGGQLNINTASFEVLRAVKGTVVDPGLIQTFVDRRGAGPDGEPGTADDCLWTPNANSLQQITDCLGLGTNFAPVNNLTAGLGYQSSVFRIAVEGQIATGAVRYRIQAIVRRGGSGHSVIQISEVPFQILAWREG